MKLLKSALLSGALAGALFMSAGSSAQALPLNGNLLGAAPAATADRLVIKVQRRGIRGRGIRRGRTVRRGRSIRRGRSFRRGAAAALGLGILGLGLAAGAAHSYPHSGGYYYDDQPRCWTERRPVYNRFGDYVGRRRVRVCN